MPECSHIDFSETLSGFPPVTLAEMDAVKLMNRIDTKYVTDEAGLQRLLSAAAASGYRVLQTEGERISPYDSVYYDTPSLKMFYDHRNKRLVRQKVRTRCYLNSGTTFLEYKRKNNHGRTKKERRPVPGMLLDLPGLSPSVETLFRRITLVNPEMTERLTIDTCVCFRNLRTGIEASLKDAVIIELKQDGRSGSRMKRLLLEERIQPFRVSKYCIGVSLSDPAAIPGRFKLKIRGIEKIIDNKITVL